MNVNIRLLVAIYYGCLVNFNRGSVERQRAGPSYKDLCLKQSKDANNQPTSLLSTGSVNTSIKKDSKLMDLQP